MADDLVPRMELKHIQVFVEGDRRRTQFSFPDNEIVGKIFGEWTSATKGKIPDTNTGCIYRAFHYWNQFVNIIKSSTLNPRPDSIAEGFEWTENTKIPSTALALLSGPLVGYDRLRRMIYQNGLECGYIVKTGVVTTAFANPDKYISSNPNERLSYLVAGFYHRDHLRDLVKQVPAYHIFRDGTDIHVVPEPNKTKKEIP